MSKHPTKTTSMNELANKVDQVAETVEQLVTTSQEKPAATTTEVEVKVPDYDHEHIKTLNVSQAVRYLHSKGFTRGQIVKEFPKVKGRTILYQHVRNVLVTPIKAS